MKRKVLTAALLLSGALSAQVVTAPHTCKSWDINASAWLAVPCKPHPKWVKFRHAVALPFEATFAVAAEFGLFLAGANK